MRITRRNVLIGFAAGAGAVGLAGLGAGGAREILPRLRAVATPRLPDGAPGPLTTRQRRILLATAEALLTRTSGRAAGSPRPDDLAPYERLFDARARQLRGYRTLYERFAAAVGREARERAGSDFVTLPAHRRQEILADLCPAGRLARLRTGLTAPDRTRFRLYVVREILDLYAATGAWRVLGFGLPAGLPRGLDAYTRPPEGLVARRAPGPKPARRSGR